MESDKKKKEKKITECVCVCARRGGGQLGVQTASPCETHDSLAYYCKVSLPFSWTLAHLSSAESGQTEMRGGERGRKKKQRKDRLTVVELIPPPHNTHTHTHHVLTHAHTNIWQHTEWVMWHFGRGRGYGGCREQSGSVYQGKGKLKFQLHYQLPAVILFFLAPLSYNNLFLNTLAGSRKMFTQNKLTWFFTWRLHLDKTPGR